MLQNRTVHKASLLSIDIQEWMEAGNVKIAKPSTIEEAMNRVHFHVSNPFGKSLRSFLRNLPVIRFL